MPYLVILIVSFVFFGCTTVQLPHEKIVQKTSNIKDLKKSLPTYKNNTIPYQLIANRSITQVKEGEKNLYGITIDKNLKQAYDGYLSADGNKALGALHKILTTSQDPKTLWQSSFLKIQTLIMMGLGDDAKDELTRCTKYEIESFQSNLNCKALSAELYAWLEDYDQAKQDASDVLQTIGSWEFPTTYPSPPSNMDKLVATTTAQMRAYTTLAAIYNLTENYKESYYWANEAEKRMNAVHYVSNHWLYGKFVKLHLDSYYGRAANMTFLAAAKLALGFSEKEVNDDFQKAVNFFEMIHYKKGIATVLALKARVYNKIADHDRCYTAGNEALQYSLKYGFLDFVWRIEAIRAETFMQLGHKEMAKKAYRRANDTINILTGALSSDTAKTQFGIGKDDIVKNLIRFDIQEKNYTQLFIDLEQNRARAFVDMLSKNTVNLSQKNSLLQQIKELDKKIQLQQLFNTSATSSKKDIEKLNQMLQKRKELSLQLQKENPKLASAVSIWSNDLNTTQSHLSQNQNIIYFIPPDKKENIQYLKISKDTVSLEELNINNSHIQMSLQQLESLLGIESLLSSRALKLNKAIVKEHKKPKNRFTDFIHNLQTKLHTNDLFSTQENYLVLSGLTHFIPWGMLTQKEFTIIPNASWLSYQDIQVSPKHQAVILANPDFNGKLPQLQGALEEGKILEKLYNQPLLTSKNATKQTLHTQTKNGVQVLHLATHGIFYKDKPLESAVFLSEAQPLSAMEIYENPIQANLVVLSACETGLGKSSSGEDLMGLQRSFFMAGTKTVLSSLWPIDDKGTKEFMKIFHTYAKDGNYIQGFTKARNELASKGYSPAIYGAFILNGLNGR
jgi:CHAT domain-containing protein